MGNAFQTTRWSLVLDARRPGPEAEKALDALCRDYWQPLLNHARYLGLSLPDAEDRVQGFFNRVISGDLFGKADPDRGRMRTFLLTAFRRYIQDEWTRARAQKRGGGFEIVSLDELGDVPDQEARRFDQEWAASLMALALKRLQARYDEEDKGNLYEILSPFIAEAVPDGGIPELAEQSGLSANAAKVALSRLRKRFAECLRREVAETLEPGGDVEGELRYLTEIVG